MPVSITTAEVEAAALNTESSREFLLRNALDSLLTPTADGTKRQARESKISALDAVMQDFTLDMGNRPADARDVLIVFLAQDMIHKLKNPKLSTQLSEMSELASIAVKKEAQRAKDFILQKADIYSKAIVDAGRKFASSVKEKVAAVKKIVGDFLKSVGAALKIFKDKSIAKAGEVLEKATVKLEEAKVAVSVAKDKAVAKASEAAHRVSFKLDERVASLGAKVAGAVASVAGKVAKTALEVEQDANVAKEREERLKASAKQKRVEQQKAVKLKAATAKFGAKFGTSVKPVGGRALDDTGSMIKTSATPATSSPDTPERKAALEKFKATPGIRPKGGRALDDAGFSSIKPSITPSTPKSGDKGKSR